MSKAAMRVAVLADIHGNLPALDAVLRDVEACGVDAIVLNGDLADGPMPAQTLDRQCARQRERHRGPVVLHRDRPAASQGTLIATSSSGSLTIGPPCRPGSARTK